MPLDVTLSPSLSLSLHDRLAFHGIKPVPMSLLEAHKREQVRRNPPSFFATKKAPVVFYLVSLVAVLGTTMPMLDLRHLHNVVHNLFIIEMLGLYAAGLVAIVAFLIVGAIWRSMGHPVYGPAKWIEQRCGSYDLWDQPRLREVVQRAHDALPDAKLICGKLMREEAVLDPYVVIKQGGEQACLCIWDDDGIIACAEVIED